MLFNMEQKLFIYGFFLITMLIITFELSIINTKVDFAVSDHNKEYHFYKDYYWKYNTSKLIEDSLMQYKMQLQMNENVIDGMTNKNADKADAPPDTVKLFDVWYEKVEPVKNKNYFR